MLPRTSFDTVPSVLHHPLDPAVTKPHSSKRQKLDEPTRDYSISASINANTYSTVEAIIQDVEVAATGVVAQIQQSQDGTIRKLDWAREGQSDIAQVRTFRDIFRSIIQREMVQRPHALHLVGEEYQSTPSETPLGNDHVSYSIFGNGNKSGGLPVLTLYGPTGQPKQLFSSLQEGYDATHMPTLLSYQKEATARASKSKPKTIISHPLSQDQITNIGLPNGISLTKIVPVHSIEPKEEKDVPTIGERFAPPIGLPSLSPPRQSKHTATRSSSVNWYNPSELVTPSQPSRRDNYNTQPLSTGQWLTYNVAPSPNQLSSPEAKRKQRNRALSFGESMSEPSEEAIALHQKAKEEALFRSVYSSFAPDRDNAGALVSETSKNRMWWNRIGQSRLHDSLVWHQLDDGGVDVPVAQEGQSIDDEASSFREAVEIWVPEELPPEMRMSSAKEIPTTDVAKDVDELLEDISELLQTLNSYQRVRNLSLASNARTSAGQNTHLSAMTGTPTSPSSDELEVYNMLKSQLTVMISTLPPYALAKLDGEKLGTLNISTKIQTSSKNYRGSLEEDEISTKAKQSAAGVSHSYPSRPTNSAAAVSSRSSYVPGASTPIQQSHRSSYVPQTVPGRPTTNTSYLPNQQYSRPPTGSHYFTGNARSSLPAARSTSTNTPDPYPYTSAQQYNQQGGRSTYANGYSQYSSQSTGNYGHGYAASQTTRPPSSTYQQPSRNSQPYSYSATPSGRSASPAKKGSSYASQNYIPQNNTASQLRPSLPHQPSSVYSAQSSSSPQVNGTSIAGYGSMIVNSPAGAANAQQDQTAEHLKTPGRQGSGTPQPSNNGSRSASRANGTPGLQPNGA
ncbi:MAG: hypothetical protein Q9190_001821 [Brigantiaea leucoxantha]